MVTPTDLLAGWAGNEVVAHYATQFSELPWAASRTKSSGSRGVRTVRHWPRFRVGGPARGYALAPAPGGTMDPGGIGEPGAIRAARPAQPSRRLNRPRASRPRSTAGGRPSARRGVCFHRSGSASRHSSMLHVVWIGRRGVNSSPQTTHRRGSLQSNGTGRRRGSCTASSFANSRRLSSSSTFGPPSPSPAPRRPCGGHQQGPSTSASYADVGPLGHPDHLRVLLVRSTRRPCLAPSIIARESLFPSAQGVPFKVATGSFLCYRYHPVLVPTVFTLPAVRRTCIEDGVMGELCPGAVLEPAAVPPPLDLFPGPRPSSLEPIALPHPNSQITKTCRGRIVDCAPARRAGAGGAPQRRRPGPGATTSPSEAAAGAVGSRPWPSSGPCRRNTRPGETVCPSPWPTPGTAELIEGVCDVDLDTLDVELPRGFGRD